MDKATSMSHMKGNGDDSIISTGTSHKICHSNQDDFHEMPNGIVAICGTFHSRELSS
jgi:hypothetical protein